MSNKDQYIDSDNAYHEPSRDPDQGFAPLIVIVTILMVVLTAVLAILCYKDKGFPWSKNKTAMSSNAVNESLIPLASPTPTPILPIRDFQNPLLYPGTSSGTAVILPENIATSALPSDRGTTQTVLDVYNDKILNDFSRDPVISMGDPLLYSDIAGIITFRGNNFRNCASFGYCIDDPNNIEVVWEYSNLGTRTSSSLDFEWKGLALTGQPLIVKWDDSVKKSMNIYESLKEEDFVEVIIATLDGKIYFFNLETGAMTRDPIDVGATVKGTPSLDPRGYPLLYVGQGDDNGNSGFGMRIFSLIDGKMLYFCNGINDATYRLNWGACDSSPIVDPMSDTLIWPSENGFIYTFNLNTSYTPGADTISVNPVPYAFKYIFNDSQGSHMGVESSIAVYNGYGYFCDNDWNLVCLDLNTMQMMWQYKLGDDSRMSPVIEEENGIPYVYVCSEVDGQGGQGEYSGAAYTYKFNGLTGEVIWQTSQPCYTYNGETGDTDQSGGCFGNPILGKKGISNLVIFSYSRTHSLEAGNLLVAYDKMTGNTVWTYDMNIHTYSSPVDVYDKDGNCYILIADTFGQIHFVDAQTGERITHIRVSSDVTGYANFEASPAVYENTLVIGSKTGSVFAVKITHTDEQ